MFGSPATPARGGISRSPEEVTFVRKRSPEDERLFDQTPDSTPGSARGEPQPIGSFERALAETVGNDAVMPQAAAAHCGKKVYIVQQSSKAESAKLLMQKLKVKVSSETPASNTASTPRTKRTSVTCFPALPQIQAPIIKLEANRDLNLLLVATPFNAYVIDVAPQPSLELFGEVMVGPEDDNGRKKLVLQSKTGKTTLEGKIQIGSGEFSGILRNGPNDECGSFRLRCHQASGGDEEIYSGVLDLDEGCGDDSFGETHLEFSLRLSLTKGKAAFRGNCNNVSVKASLGTACLHKIDPAFFRETDDATMDAAWHPLFDKKVVLLQRSGQIRMYDGASSTCKTGWLKPQLTQRLLSSQDGMNCVALGFGASTACTERLEACGPLALLRRCSTYVMCSNGAILGVCALGVDRSNSEEIVLFKKKLSDELEQGRDTLPTEHCDWIKKQIHWCDLAYESGSGSGSRVFLKPFLIAPPSDSPSSQSVKSRMGERSSATGFAVLPSKASAQVTFLRSWSCGHVDMLAGGRPVFAMPYQREQIAAIKDDPLQIKYINLQQRMMAALKKMPSNRSLFDSNLEPQPELFMPRDVAILVGRSELFVHEEKSNLIPSNSTHFGYRLLRDPVHMDTVACFGPCPLEVKLLWLPSLILTNTDKAFANLGRIVSQSVQDVTADSCASIAFVAEPGVGHLIFAATKDEVASIDVSAIRVNLCSSLPSRVLKAENQGQFLTDGNPEEEGADELPDQLEQKLLDIYRERCTHITSIPNEFHGVQIVSNSTPPALTLAILSWLHEMLDNLLYGRAQDNGTQTTGLLQSIRSGYEVIKRRRAEQDKTFAMHCEALQKVHRTLDELGGELGESQKVAKDLAELQHRTNDGFAMASGQVSRICKPLSTAERYFVQSVNDLEGKVASLKPIDPELTKLNDAQEPRPNEPDTTQSHSKVDQLLENIQSLQTGTQDLLDSMMAGSTPLVTKLFEDSRDLTSKLLACADTVPDGTPEPVILLTLDNSEESELSSSDILSNHALEVDERILSFDYQSNVRRIHGLDAVECPLYILFGNHRVKVVLLLSTTIEQHESVVRIMDAWEPNHGYELEEQEYGDIGLQERGDAIPVTLVCVPADTTSETPRIGVNFIEDRLELVTEFRRLQDAARNGEKVLLAR